MLHRTLALALFMLATADAMATAQRTFVASNGNDANPCSLVLPCRSFGAAITQTNAGGEVIVLDSAGYGPVTITQSISIIAPAGVYAGIAVPGVSGTGITIAAAATDIVVLRGLTLNGPGNYGISVLSAGEVHVESVVINGFGYEAITVDAVAKIYIIDSIIRNNFTGAYFTASGGQVYVSIDHSRFENIASFGIWADANARVSVRNSVISGDGGYGLWATESDVAYSEVNIENCVIMDHFTGVVSGAGARATATNAIVRLSNNLITANNAGVLANYTNILLSGGGNTIEGNAVDGTVTGTYLKK